MHKRWSFGSLALAPHRVFTFVVVDCVLLWMGLDRYGDLRLEAEAQGRGRMFLRSFIVIFGLRWTTRQL